MKKLISLFILIPFAILAKSELIEAGSDLGVWCLAKGLSWISDTSTCRIIKVVSIPLDETLTVESGETILIEELNGYGINNYGTINNAGLIFVDGVIDNFGVIENGGTIDNEGAIFNNQGTIKNNGIINNHLQIHNYAAINNDGLINVFQNGKIDNLGSIINESEIVNHGEISQYGESQIKNDAAFFNFGTINNAFGAIENNGVINSYCSAIFEGQPPIGNPVYYYSGCGYLPLALITNENQYSQ